MTALHLSAEHAATKLARYRAARSAGDVAGAWCALERAHILAQARFGMHFRVHCAMLCFAIARRDRAEIAGQLLRLVLTPLGHAVGRLPQGNTGRANVSAFAPMPVPPDLCEDVVKGARP